MACIKELVTNIHHDEYEGSSNPTILTKSRWPNRLRVGSNSGLNRTLTKISAFFFYKSRD